MAAAVGGKAFIGEQLKAAILRRFPALTFRFDSLLVRVGVATTLYYLPQVRRTELFVLL